MTTLPLVSVIVPSYNHETFILECLESIHAQTYRNVELVVVDDASSDDTYNRCLEYLTPEVRGRFADVKVHRNHQNAGAHQSLNAAVNASCGEIIAVVNSDDVYTPTRIDVMLAAMRSHQTAVCFSLVDAFGDIGATPQNSLFRCLAARQLMEAAREPTIGFALLRKNIAVSTGNLMFTREMFDRVGGFVSLLYCHDWDFVLQSVRYAEPVLVRERLYRYRLHGANSYRTLADQAMVETEIVLRRFFRGGIAGTVTNDLCPCERNWPGVFTAFVREIGSAQFLARECGLGLTSWRTLEQAPESGTGTTAYPPHSSALSHETRQRW